MTTTNRELETYVPSSNAVQPFEEVQQSDMVPYSAVAPLLLHLRDGNNLPIHDQILVNEFSNPDEREQLSGIYNGTEPRKFSDFNGRIMEVYGMILYEVPTGWKGKDGLTHEGYFQVRMLVKDDQMKGEPIIVVKSAGIGLAKHVYHIVTNPNRGWFLFPKPIKYRFEVGSDNSHRILNMEHDVKSLLSAGKGK